MSDPVPSPNPPARRPDIRALQAALAAGVTSSEAMVADRLALLAREQARLNAFIESRGEAALAEARRADERRRTGAVRGPLDGIAIALKDMFVVSGRQPSYGAPPARVAGDDWAGDATEACVVGRIVEAGAINLGFLNMAPFALGATGHNPTYGDCRNPWDDARISGGSSSGAAAAVAAGIVDAAVGSDTGGSIRIPAACCGLVGLRPTTGRISRTGAMPLAPSFDVIGPIAPCVDDLAILFSALCGPDPLDPASLILPTWQSPELEEVEGGAFTIVWPEADIAAACDETIAAAIAAAVAALRSAGARVRQAVLPDIGELHALADLVQAAEAAALHGARLDREPDCYAAAIRRRIEPGLAVSAVDYLDAVRARVSHRRQFVGEVLRGNRILAIPTLCAGVPTIADTDPEVAPPAVAMLTRWTRWISYLDLPALSLPCGFDANGMPIGIQLVAEPFAEARLLALGALYERLTLWPNRPATLVSR